MKLVNGNTDWSVLARLQLLRNVPPESIQVYLEQSPILELSRNDILISPEKSNKQVYSLLSGALRVHLDSVDKDPYTIINPGECVGEMSVIESKEPSAYVVAAEDSRVLAISQEILWAMLSASHGIARNLLYILSGRLRQDDAFITRLLEEQRRFEREANIDALTGLYNRRWMLEMFGRELERCIIDGDDLCLMMLDVDFFKQINDAYGHRLGDEVLSLISKALRRSLRPNDMIARYGGDEFIILLPQTSLNAAGAIGKRLLAGISSLSFSDLDGGLPLNASISIGLAMRQDKETLEDLLEEADAAMYQAKEDGRNRIRTRLFGS